MPRTTARMAAVLTVTVTTLMAAAASPAAADPITPDGAEVAAPRAAEAVLAAAGPRPTFQLPFACGARILLGTYGGHGDYEIDMGASEGTPLRASAAGTAYRGHSNGGGYQVSILHDNGWRTLYLHLQANSYQFADGARVQMGQHLANTGNTGTNTSGPHLHYEQQNQIDGSWRAVHAWFNGQPSDITDDARRNSYYDTSRNCGQSSTAGGVAAGDVTGDGYADLVGRRSDGTLALYPNNGAGATAPYGPNRVVGSGWQSMSTFRVADVTGDGKADIVAVGADGALLLYAHSGDNAAPYGTGRGVGTGWASFRHVTVADVTGDSKADILGVAADGALLLYAHSGDNAAPYGSGRQVGTGWAGFSHVSAADVTGDDKADVVTVSTDGSLRVYAHGGDNAAPYSAGAVIGSGWQSFDRVMATDATGDGKADIVGTHPDGNLYLYTHSGDNTAPYGTGRLIGSGWNTLA